MARRKRRGKGRNCQQGTYIVENKEKYVGKSNPRYLSSWERHADTYLDHHPNVIEWGAETVVVKYYDPMRQRNRRYMVDLYFKVKDASGDIITYLAEVKPHAQTLPPKKTARKRQDVYEEEQRTYITNQCKWQAAEEYAKVRGWRFIKLTEYEIFKKGKPPSTSG